MFAVRVMKAPVHEIIDMVAMRHRLVAAIGAVTVFSTVAGGMVFGIAAIRIHVTDRDRMLMRPTVLAVFETAVVEVIHVTFMLHGDVTAARTVHVRGTFAGRLGGGWHCNFLSPLGANQIAPGGLTTAAKTRRWARSKNHFWNERPAPHFSALVDLPSVRSRSATPRWASQSRSLSNSGSRVHRQRCRRPSLPRKVPVAGSYDL